MSEHRDDPQDWPLRGWSNRLRPPGHGPEPEPEPEPASEVVPDVVVPDVQSRPALGELVYDEPPAAPLVEEHAEGEFRVPEGYSVLEGAPAGRRRAVAIVVSRFNGEITN